MAEKRRDFSRPLGRRRYRKLFIVAVEGMKTEPQYFGLFNGENSVVQVTCLKDPHDSAPQHVLARMQNHLRKEALRESDAAWLVVDKDQWPDEELAQLYEWASRSKNYGFALSNPKFEYWILLHFEDGNNVASSQQCSTRLRKHLPDYDKGIDIRKITPKMIEDAVRRARNRDNPPCQKWPEMPGTTVYKLVESILQA